MRYRLKMEDTQIVEDALVCTTLVCSAVVYCQEVEEKRRQRMNIWTRKFLLDYNKYGAQVVTVNALRENDPHAFRRSLRMSSEVYEVHTITRSEYNKNEKLVNLVPRTFYDFEVICTL